MLTSPRDEAERARELLVAELNHRVKNTLSIVQAIAVQTFKSNGGSSDAWPAFEGRLLALGRAHSLLTQTNWENASLEDLAALILQAHGANRVRVGLKGPSISLSPKQALSIGLALHELSTNAMKYGALSNSSGRIDVTWERIDAGEPRLRLSWRETGGPSVKPPNRAGFGSFLPQRVLGEDLNGEVNVRFDPAGLFCLLETPLHEETRGTA
jgi:two-component sensor histidine kinase